MKEVEDAKWRDAAAMLGLALVRPDGKTVSAKAGTRRHRMQGTIDSHRVTADCGLRHMEDGVIVVSVHLSRPLLLGLCVQVSAPPRTATGVPLGGGLRTTVEALELGRARAMLDATAAGKDLVACLDSLGSLGWVELRDVDVRTQCEAPIDTPDGYAKLVRVAVRAAVLAEKARSALAPTDWELRLRGELEAVAADLRVPFDAALLQVAGDSRDARVELGIEVDDPSWFRCRARLPRPLPAGSRVCRRTRFWSKVAAWLGLDRPSSDAEFNRTFEASRPVRARLTHPVALRLLDMSRSGEVVLDEEAVTHRVPVRDATPAKALAGVRALLDALDPRPAPSPYRDATG